MAGRFHPLGHGQQERNGRDGPRRDLHGRRRKRQREQAELAGDIGAGEDAVSGDVVGTGWPGGYDALQALYAGLQPAEPPARRTLTGRWADAPAARAALDVATGREETE